MFNTKFVIYIIGILLLVETAFLAISTGVSLYYGESDFEAFLLTTLLTATVGGISYLLTRKHSKQLKKREGFFIVAITWVIFSLFGMLPFVLSGSIPSVTDAFFETMSGFTTTGASILNNIESLPHAVLFWRSLIQWLGGMGIIVFTIALLPKLGVEGGVHLFNSESPGLTHEKIAPRIDQTAKRLWGIYLGITALLTLLLWAGPMELFDSVCHAFTAMATGGYSTKQASVAYWNSAYIDYVLTIFMFIAGTNFTLVYLSGRGKLSKLFGNEEFRWYGAIVLVVTLLFSIELVRNHTYDNPTDAFRYSIFQVVSLITTTGYATADYVAWGSFFWILSLMLMVSGGSAGSTAGGMKVVRILVMLKNSIIEFRKQLHPNAVMPVRVNKTVVPYDLVTRVLAFLFIYLLIILISIAYLTFIGINFEEAVGAVITSISNVGPGLGASGPAGNFSGFPDQAKWFLSFIMLVGRLELFTVLIIFTPSFWKR